MLLTIRRVRSVLKMSENEQFRGRIYFSTKHLRPYPNAQCKSIIQRALRKSRVNGATKLKLYSIGKYLEVCQKFFRLRGVRGAQDHPNVNLGPPIISETTAAKKFKLQTQLNMVKYPLWVQKLLYYTIEHDGGRHIDFRQMYVSPRQTTANNCKTAFSLHVVESASEDYNF